MQQEIKNAQCEFKTSSLKGYHEVIVSFSVYGVEQKSVIFVRDHTKWKDADYFNEAKKQFNKKIESGEIKMSKHQSKTLVGKGGKRRSKKLLIAFTSIVAAAAISLGGFLVYKYLIKGNGGEKYTVTWLDWDGTILEQDKDVEVGTMPTFDFSKAPLKPYDGTNFWSFNNWDHEVEKITNSNQTYIAHYDPLVIEDDIDAYMKMVITNGGDLTFDFEFEPLSGEDLEIDWGDGTTAAATSSHTYVKPGAYNIKIKNITSIKTPYKGKPTNGNIQEIYLGNHITSIPNSAFERCQNLKTVIFSNDALIGESAFQDCQSLSFIKIPSILTSIPTSVFNGCSSLTSCNIPSSVTKISRYAFQGCSSLTSIDLSNVTTIEGSAFQECSSLTSIDISKATYIGAYAFDSCSSLVSVEIPSTLEYGQISDGVFRNCSKLQSVSLPSNITQISQQVFLGCSSLKSINLSNVTSIGTSAFENCTSLDSVDIAKVTNLNASAFQGCTALTSVTIPNGVSKIGEYAFQNCTSLASVSINNGVKTIGVAAFSGCSALISLELPNNLITIDDSAFRQSAIASITIPGTVKKIGRASFDLCSDLAEINITAFQTPDSIPQIDTFAFYRISDDAQNGGFKVYNNEMRAAFIARGVKDVADGKVSTWPTEENAYTVVS